MLELLIGRQYHRGNGDYTAIVNFNPPLFVSTMTSNQCLDIFTQASTVHMSPRQNTSTDGSFGCLFPMN